jgi:hypothetical protein
MSTPELLNTVQEVFEVLKGGKASLGDILSLVQKFSVENASKVSEVFEMAILRVEKEVVSLLPDGQKAVFSDNLALVRKIVSEHASVKTTILTQLKNLLSRFLPGLCGGGGQLPELPTQVVAFREVVEKVADLPAVKAVETAVGVSVVQEAAKVLDASVVQKTVEQVVEQAMKKVEEATEVVSTQQVTPEVPEHETQPLPSSTVVEENQAQVPQDVQDNKMD